MNHIAPAPAARRFRTLGLVGLAVVIAAIVGTLGNQSRSSSAVSFADIPRDEHGGSTTQDAAAVAEDDGAVTEKDGVLPKGVTVFDDQYPGVANLDTNLLHALREAASDAADEDIAIKVNSGWRSPEYQEQLLREAVSKFGSEEEAARLVATPSTSAHVSGDAVDIGPFDAKVWLARHGATYGLCQIYRNESWHYELRPEAIGLGCPPMLADPAHARLQR